MPIPSFVFHHIHPMVGLDLENSIIPPAPAVIPYTPYMAVTVLSGNMVQSSYTKKTFALSNGISIMQQGTDCGYLGVPHFGNPANALYPIILGLSKSKSQFGASTVKVEGTPVATSIFLGPGINLNCGTISTPTGIVIPPTTVMAGMTPGDVVAGIFNVVVDVVWDLACKKIFGSNQTSNYVTSRILGKVWGTVFDRLLPEGAQISHELIKRTIEKLVKKFVFEKAIKKGVGLLPGEDKPKSVGQAIEEKIRHTDAWQKSLETGPVDTF